MGVGVVPMTTPLLSSHFTSSAKEAVVNVAGGMFTHPEKMYGVPALSPVMVCWRLKLESSVAESFPAEEPPCTTSLLRVKRGSAGSKPNHTDGSVLLLQPSPKPGFSSRFSPSREHSRGASGTPYSWPSSSYRSV